MIGLDAKNKICFVDGSLPKPEHGATHEKTWKRCDNIVIGWIISSLKRHIEKSIIYLKTTSCIWKYLKGRFGPPSSSYMYRLQEKLFNTTYDLGMTIAEYFTKVKSLRDEIDDLRPLLLFNCHHTTNFVKIQQDQRLMTFLMKLEPNYNQVRINLLIRKDMLDVSEVYRMFLQEKSHRDLHKDSKSTDFVAFGAERMKPYKRGKDKDQSNRRKPTYFCELCKSLVIILNVVLKYIGTKQRTSRVHAKLLLQ